MSQVTHLCLNQEVSLRPHMFQEPHHVHCSLILNLLQHTVYDYVGSCPPNTGTVTHMACQALIRILTHN